jgi:hypothetical protein
MTDAQRRRAHFLERKCIRPVLEADASKFPENKRDQLKDMQSRTEKEIERFRAYKSAEGVVANFKRDLHSQAAKEVHGELQAPGLPTLPDVRDEFEKLAKSLGHH